MCDHHIAIAPYAANLLRAAEPTAVRFMVIAAKSNTTFHATANAIGAEQNEVADNSEHASWRAVVSGSQWLANGARQRCHLGRGNARPTRAARSE
jgi:hypothetical protein